MYRKTYVEVDTDIIGNNVKNIRLLAKLDL